MNDHARYDRAARRAAHVLVDMVSVGTVLERTSDPSRDEIVVVPREFIDHRSA